MRLCCGTGKRKLIAMITEAPAIKAILGWQLDGAESIIFYRGGRLLSLTRAWLWYQFEFEVESRLDDDDGVDMGELPFFDTMYADWIKSPDAQLPSDYPALDPDMSSMVDLTEDPDAGEYGMGFGTGFDWHKD